MLDQARPNALPIVRTGPGVAGAIRPPALCRTCGVFSGLPPAEARRTHKVAQGTGCRLRTPAPSTAQCKPAGSPPASAPTVPPLHPKGALSCLSLERFACNDETGSSQNHETLASFAASRPLASITAWSGLPLSTTQLPPTQRTGSSASQFGAVIAVIPPVGQKRHW